MKRIEIIGDWWVLPVEVRTVRLTCSCSVTCWACGLWSGQGMLMYMDWQQGILVVRSMPVDRLGDESCGLSGNSWDHDGVNWVMPKVSASEVTLLSHPLTFPNNHFQSVCIYLHNKINIYKYMTSTIILINVKITKKHSHCLCWVQTKILYI